MKFIGDTHGKLLPIIDDIVYHVGDVGVGIKKNLIVPENYRFIAGNHDDRELCRTMPNYLGDYGMVKQHNMFFMSGGKSIDAHLRHENIDWWSYEELGQAEMYSAMDVYEDNKPEIVITHEAPIDVLYNLFGFTPYQTRTNQCLGGMLYIHKPKLWVFGHYHQSIDTIIDGTRFVCLNELEVKDLLLENSKITL